MTKVDILNSNLNNLENNIQIYQEEIKQIILKVDQVVKMLKDNQKMDDTIWDTMLSYSLSDFSSLEMGLLSVDKITTSEGIVDYSVDMSNLTYYDEITLSNGEKYTIYSSNKTDALYVISNIKDNNLKREMFININDKLKNDQMVIMTFDGNPYKGDVYNSKSSTRDFGFVAKNDQGKAISFHNTKGNVAKIPHSSLIVSYKGLAMPMGGTVATETNAQYDMEVLYQNDNVPGVLVKQSGLRRCCLFVQKHDKNANAGIGQDMSAEFVIGDEVLENACDRKGKRDDGKPVYLSAKNDNYYEGRYHTIFEESASECEKLANQRGYIGTHKSSFPVTLNTYYANNGYWNSYNFTLTGNRMDGGQGDKQMWSTTNSYCVDDWSDMNII